MTKIHLTYENELQVPETMGRVEVSTFENDSSAISRDISWVLAFMTVCLFLFGSKATNRNLTTSFVRLSSSIFRKARNNSQGKSNETTREKRSSKNGVS
jgi:hypothetical protein